MPLLPAPTTLSPGKLKILYSAGALNHEVGTNFNATVTITDVPTIRTEALALIAVIAPCLDDTCIITGWKITDPSGVTLYEEVLDTPVGGSRPGLGGDVSSQSASIALTGKGAPSVGLKQGQIKFTLFPNVFNSIPFEEARLAIDGWNGMSDLRDFLNSSTVTGSDFYGSPGVWRSYIDTQVNAHFQKRYGL